MNPQKMQPKHASSSTTATTSSLTDIPTRLESLLRPRLRLLEDGGSLDPEQNLGKAGLDSLATIELLVEIEETFETTIPDEEIDENTFNSLSTIARLVERSLPAAA